MYNNDMRASSKKAPKSIQIERKRSEEIYPIQKALLTICSERCWRKAP